MKEKYILLVVLAILAIFGWNKYGYLFQSAKNWPKIENQIPDEPIKQPVLTEQDKAINNTIFLPEDFTITYFANNVPGARSLAIGSNGIVYVGTRNEGIVYALEDSDQDGRADMRYVIARNLTMPNGVAYHNGDLYVAENAKIIRFKDIDSNYPNKPASELIFGALPTETHHGWRYLAIGPDNKLYVAIGAPCNICDEEDPFATIGRLNLDGSNFEIIARGVRNSVGFDWSPTTGNLWFTDNGRDWLGDDSPPDELNILTSPLQHFGFPFCHGENTLDPDFGTDQDCSQYTTPVQELGPHVAALGIDFYQGSTFPAEYKRKLFIAEHGSWNRKDPIGYRITTVDINGDTGDNYQVFAEGWLDNEGNASGRPVDILELSDGSILVSDDKSGAVYKIQYSGDTK